MKNVHAWSFPPALVLALFSTPPGPTASFAALQEQGRELDARTSLAGTWRTTFGVLELEQIGDRFLGRYEFGTLEGSLRGSRLQFTFREGPITGEGWFQLLEDGRSFQGGRREDGEERWENWTGTTDEPPSEYARAMAEAEAAYAAGRYADAFEPYERALELEADDGDASYGLARLWNRESDVEMAFLFLDQAAAGGFGDPDAATIELSTRRDDPRFEDLLLRFEHNRREARWRARGGMQGVLRLRAELERLGGLDAASPLVWMDGHGEACLGLRFSPSGDRLATWSDDGTLRLWDALTGEHLELVTRHGARAGESSELSVLESVVGATAAASLRSWGGFASSVLFSSEADLKVEFSADGERLLVLDRAAAWVGLFDGKSGEFVARLAADESPVLAAAFRPDGRQVATATRRGEILFWNGADGHPLPVRLRTDGAASVEFSPDGKLLLSLAADGRVRLWDAGTGVARGVLSSPGVLLREASFGPDGQSVLARAGGSWLAWTLGTGGRVGREQEVSRFLRRPDAAALYRPRFAATTGRLFAVSDGPLVSWDLETGASERVGPPLVPELLWLSPDGERILINSPTRTELWSPSGRIAEVTPPTVPATGGPAHGPDGRSFVLGKDRAEIVVWDARTGERAVTLEGANGTLYCSFEFSPDGRRLALVTESASPQIWSLDDPSQPLELGSRSRGQHLSTDGELLCSHPVGSQIAIGAQLEQGPAQTSLWDPRSGLPVRRYSSSSVLVSATAARPGEFCAWGRAEARPGTFRIGLHTCADGAERWSVTAEGSFFLETIVARRLLAVGQRTHLLDTATGEVVLELDNGVGAEEAIRGFGAALSPDSTQVVQAGRRGSLSWWTETAEEQLVHLPAHSDLISFAEFRSDGRLLVTTSRDGTAVLWDAGPRRRLHVLEGHAGPVVCGRFSPDGSLVATAGHDGTARVWSVADGAERLVLRGREDEHVTHVVFHPSGGRLFTGSANGVVRSWDLADGSALLELEAHTAGVAQMFLDPRGTRIYTSGEDHAARVWNAETGALLMTRVECADGDWIAFAPSGHYAGTRGAADVVRLQVESGRRRELRSLSCYESILHDPAKVAASLGGEDVPRPFLPEPPRVRIDAPRSGLAATRSFTLEVTASGRAGIEGIAVLQDGIRVEPHRVLAGTERPTAREAWLSLPLEIPRGRLDTEIVVRAWDGRGIQSESERLRLHHVPPARDLYLVAVGVADYEDDSLDLAYPVKDVDDLIARFELEAGRLYGEVHVERLADDDVTPGRLRKAREEFLLRAEPDDTILVFAAGHGVRSGSGEYYLLTPGTTPAEPYDGIERQVLESLVTWDRLHAGRRVLLLDTCHSGDAFGEGGRGEPVDLFAQKEVDDAAGRGLYIIAASSDKGLAREMAGNGIFTRALIEGLDGAADLDRNGLVGIEELKAYATRAVHERSRGRQRPTAPRVVGGEDFPLARVR